MPLSDYDKIILNELIDSCVSDIKPVVEFAKIPEFRGMLKDKDASDFSLGLVLAEINAVFRFGFKMRNGRHLIKEENDQVFNILGKRIGEIYDAVFKCG